MNLDAMTSCFSKFNLSETAAISLAPVSDEHVLHLDAQSCETLGSQAQLAATSSNNSIRIFSRSNLANCQTISGHEDLITCVRFSPRDSNLLFSSSHDKTLRCWDTRASVTKEVNCFTGPEDTACQLNSLDVSRDGRVICAGTEADKDDNAYIIFWDCRHTKAMGAYSESHDDDITQVKFHPDKKDILASGSTDGLVCLYDISEQSEDDALYGTLNSESSVAEIGWCGAKNENVFCTTHIDTFYVWDSTEMEIVSEVKNLKEQYKGDSGTIAVDYLINSYWSNHERQLSLVAGNHVGDIFIFGLEGNDAKLKSTLKSGHKDDVRCLTYDKTSDSLVTGGDDSLLCLWNTETPVSPTKDSYKMKQKKKRR